MAQRSLRLGMRLTLTHVLGRSTQVSSRVDGSVPVGYDARLKQVERRARTLLDALLDGVRNASSVEVRLRHGDAGKQLTALAQEDPTELVVVGSRGRGPVRAALLGSTSMQLLRQCEVPVVVCPSR